MDEKSTWSPTRRTMDKVLWSPKNFARPTDLQEVGLTQILGDRDFILFFQQDRFHDKFQLIFEDKQTPPSSSLKLVEFGTYYNIPNPPLFFPPIKYAMVPQHDPFSLHTMLEDP